MHLRKVSWLGCMVVVTIAALSPIRAFPQDDSLSGIAKVQHVIVFMQENHSFDNYFGALPYAPHSPYHPGIFGCGPEDHNCVDGLSCLVDASGEPHCFNANLDSSGHLVFAFHDPRRCAVPDLNHSWFPTHQEANFQHPQLTLFDTKSDGFVRVNQATEQPNNLDDTMGFYTQNDIPFYYNLAENFAISDRYFSSVLGPTFPNRSYFMAATSFGHLTTSDTFPPPGGYKPITGTIFDLLEKNGITWNDYFQDAPQGAASARSEPLAWIRTSSRCRYFWLRLPALLECLLWRKLHSSIRTSG
jgi:phospholipase C